MDAALVNKEKTTEQIAELSAFAGRIVENVEKVIVGRRDAVEMVLIALLCEGHVILEDVPGVGKTMLAKAVARSLDCSFSRVQFTSDLLPSDVTGLNVFNQKTCEFQFTPGPIMASVVLADEINRATPRTQACLLEAMQERQVTVDGLTRALPRPFVVLATQNPVEQAGTFPLPEAQLDRFLLRIRGGYPSFDSENEILDRFGRGNPLDDLKPEASADEIMRMKDACRNIFVEDSLREYMVKIVRATRDHEAVRLGASPRASLALYDAARAKAAVDGRAFILPDDVKAMAQAVLAHRLVLHASARLKGRSDESIMKEITESVDVPVG